MQGIFFLLEAQIDYIRFPSITFINCIAIAVANHSDLSSRRFDLRLSHLVHILPEMLNTVHLDTLNLIIE